MEEYYSLRRSDFFPVRGLLDYEDRVYLDKNREKKEGDMKKIKRRSLLLLAYNIGVFVGTAFVLIKGLEKLFE